MAVKAPIVVDVAYRDDGGIAEQIKSVGSDASDERELSDDDRECLLTYPTVYIIHQKHEHGGHDEYIAYVGETNSIARRTEEHYNDGSANPEGNDQALWCRLNDPHETTGMFVIGHEHFNKSLTLDVENQFLSYVLASDADIKLANGRTNPQDDYYTRDELPRIVSSAWGKLHKADPRLFPAEKAILNSAIFKASPFHRLGDDQLKAEQLVLDRVQSILAAPTEVDHPQLILIEGAAGTGKTVLLSHLFLQIATLDTQTDPFGRRHAPSAELIVNHHEQLTVYNSIMRRLGLQRKDDEVVFMATPFINRHSDMSFKRRADRQKHPSDPIDVAFVDEAHLLLTQGNQSYIGNKNQLLDIMMRARVVVAVFDPNQVLRKEQEVGPEMLSLLFPEGRFPDASNDSGERAATIGDLRCDVSNIKLGQQFRIDACDEVVDWIDDFAAGRLDARVPQDTKGEGGHIPYEIKVFDSPFDLRKAIERRASSTSHGLSRLLATYDWNYVKKSNRTWEVRISRDEGGWVALDNRLEPAEDWHIREERGSYFHMPWNNQLDNPDKGPGERDKAWAEKSYTLGEAGSIYTIQGFDLNYAGVIIGPSVKYRNGHVVFDKDASYNSQAINGSESPEENLRHELNVLLKRGVHGLYLFAVDPALQARLQELSVGV